MATQKYFLGAVIFVVYYFVRTAKGISVQKPDWPDWLELICSKLNCSPKFREALDQQLAEQAYILAGIDVRKRFCLVLVDATVHYEPDNVAYLETDLIAHDNWRYWVQIAWRCEVHANERTAPEEPLLPSHECSLCIRWEHIPNDELRAKYTNPIHLPFALSDSFSFEIEWQYFAWPDVWVELQTRQEVSEEKIQAVEVVLEQAREEWNRRPQEWGIIHNWSGLRPLNARQYEMYIDFGSADKRAMSDWLLALKGVSSALSLMQVIVRGVPWQKVSS